MEAEREKESGSGLLSALLFFGTALLIGGVFVRRAASYAETERGVLIACIGAGAVIYLLQELRIRNAPRRGRGRLGWFVLCYALALTLAVVVFPQVSYLAWPFPVFYAWLSLCSDAKTGFFCGTFLLALTLLVTESGNQAAFFLYLFSGMATAALFQHPEDRPRAGLSVFIVCAVQAVLTMAAVLLFPAEADFAEPLSAESLLTPAANLLASALMLPMALYVQSEDRGGRGGYTDINDPESELLSALKQLNVEEYYRSVHTAYLTERAASRLKLRTQAAKACAYYHQIWQLAGASSWENVSRYCEEFHFPQEARDLLREYTEAGEHGIRAKETTVVMMCDAVVTSLMYMFKKDRKMQINYDELINRIFTRKSEGGDLAQSGLSLSEYRQLREVLKGEKIYYDFLR